MREIPEDIRATVEDLFEDSLMRPFRNDEAKRLVARAILAERERYQWQPIETAPHGAAGKPSTYGPSSQARSFLSEVLDCDVEELGGQPNG